MVNQQKSQSVEDIVKQLQENPNFVMVKFEKTTHQTFEGLRKLLKKEQSRFNVIKNTLFEKAINRLAIENKQIKELKKSFFPLRESTALLSLGQEWNKGMNVFYQFIQKEKTIGFKFGILDNQGYDESTLVRIAKLPGKDQLVAQVIGSLKSPTSKLVYSMKYNTQKLVYILKEKSKSN